MATITPAEDRTAGQRELGILWFLPFNAQVRDIIYGYIDYVKGFEDRIIDSWPLQRLRYIYQLQTAHFVYPNATHTRFSHSLGVMHLSFLYVNQLLKTISREKYSGRKWFSELMSRNRPRTVALAARIVGLLHDIGHGPFSHAFDQYVYKKKDYLGFRVGNHEIMGYIIYRDFLREKIKGWVREYSDLGVDAEKLLEIIDDSLKPPGSAVKYTDLTSRNVLRLEEFYHPLNEPEKAPSLLVRMIVRDYVYTSDIIDYLLRDSYYTGLPLGNINNEWLLRNTYIIDYNGNLSIGISYKANDDLIRLLNARKMMYKNVYLHHVNLAFTETIGLIINALRDYIAPIIEKMLSNSEDLEKYYLLTDTGLYGLMHRVMINREYGNIPEDKREIVKQSLENLFMYRKPIWKRLDTFTADLRKIRYVFSTRFGEVIQDALVKAVKEEVSAELKSKGFTPDDVHVVILKIDIYPSATRESVKTLVQVKTRDEVPVHINAISPNEFALRYGLVPEALFIVYLNRVKYRGLREEDINKARRVVADILKDLMGKRIEELPETS